MHNPATIKDIAKALGVSVSTVSRALKNHPDISITTKEAVQELAQNLNYKPNAVALSLKNNKTKTIGVIIPEIIHYFFSTVISGIEDVAYEAGYNVMVCQSNESQEREATNIQALMANRMEGALISISKETLEFDHIRALENSGMPIVFFDRAPSGFDIDCVIIDDKKAGYKATSHLIDIGRNRIAHLTAPDTLAIGKERLSGYLQALSDDNIPFREEYLLVADNFELATKATRQLMMLPDPPDAIFAVNDQTAAGVLKELQRMKLEVPEKVAVIGFSAGLFSDIMSPTLSSVDQHGYEMGVKATKVLLERINSNEKSTGKTYYIETDLVVRESTTKKL